MKKYLPILRSSPFFKGLKDNEILSILHCVNATVISKERDSYIFRAGDSTDVMGLVVSGGVLVIKEDLWGHRNILSKCHAGDFFGEPYAASSGAVLNISVVADEDCEIVFLNVQRLLITCSTACEHHQKLIRNLVSVLANKILILNDKITHVGKRTTRDKLLSYLSAEIFLLINMNSTWESNYFCCHFFPPSIALNFCFFWNYSMINTTCMFDFQQEEWF